MLSRSLPVQKGWNMIAEDLKCSFSLTCLFCHTVCTHCRMEAPYSLKLIPELHCHYGVPSCLGGTVHVTGLARIVQPYLGSVLQNRNVMTVQTSLVEHHINTFILLLVTDLACSGLILIWYSTLPCISGEILSVYLFSQSHCEIISFLDGGNYAQTINAVVSERLGMNLLQVLTSSDLLWAYKTYFRLYNSQLHSNVVSKAASNLLYFCILLNILLLTSGTISLKYTQMCLGHSQWLSFCLFACFILFVSLLGAWGWGEAITKKKRRGKKKVKNYKKEKNIKKNRINILPVFFFDVAFQDEQDCFRTLLFSLSWYGWSRCSSMFSEDWRLLWRLGLEGPTSVK